MTPATISVRIICSSIATPCTDMLAGNHQIRDKNSITETVVMPATSNEMASAIDNHSQRNLRGSFSPPGTSTWDFPPRKSITEEYS